MSRSPSSPPRAPAGAPPDGYSRYVSLSTAHVELLDRWLLEHPEVKGRREGDASRRRAALERAVELLCGPLQRTAANVLQRDDPWQRPATQPARLARPTVQVGAARALQTMMEVRPLDGAAPLTIAAAARALNFEPTATLAMLRKLRALRLVVQLQANLWVAANSGAPAPARPGGCTRLLAHLRAARVETSFERAIAAAPVPVPLPSLTVIEQQERPAPTCAFVGFAEHRGVVGSCTRCSRSFCALHAASGHSREVLCRACGHERSDTADPAPVVVGAGVQLF